MNINEILTGGGISLAVVMTLIQVAPVKLNPWTWVGNLCKKGINAIGKTMNSEVLSKIARIETELAAVQQQVEAMSDASDEQAAISARARILRFGDEVLHGQKHSKEHFDSILRDAKKYERYCAAHESFENGITEPTVERIREVYQERLEKNDFL